MSSVGYTRFTEEEDAQLWLNEAMGVPIAEQAERMGRPVGSVKSRRRILGISKARTDGESVPSPVQYEHEPTLTFVAVLMCFVLFGIGLTILGDL